MLDNTNNTHNGIDPFVYLLYDFSLKPPGNEMTLTSEYCSVQHSNCHNDPSVTVQYSECPVPWCLPSFPAVSYKLEPARTGPGACGSEHLVVPSADCTTHLGGKSWIRFGTWRAAFSDSDG